MRNWKPSSEITGRGCMRSGILSLVSVRVSLVAQIVQRLHAMPETWVRSLGWEDPLEKEMATYSSTLPGKFHGQRS